MYLVSAEGIVGRIINVHYYYYVLCHVVVLRVTLLNLYSVKRQISLLS